MRVSMLSIQASYIVFVGCHGLDRMIVEFTTFYEFVVIDYKFCNHLFNDNSYSLLSKGSIFSEKNERK
jgi:hypothetical protein